eukprot:Gb_17107 [translate_table: standard]
MLEVVVVVVTLGEFVAVETSFDLIVELLDWTIGDDQANLQRDCTQFDAETIGICVDLGLSLIEEARGQAGDASNREKNASFLWVGNGSKGGNKTVEQNYGWKKQIPAYYTLFVELENRYGAGELGISEFRVVHPCISSTSGYGGYNCCAIRSAAISSGTDAAPSSYIPAAPISLPEGPWKQVVSWF